jgi:methylenetetrahydrofolate reductase (NADPH)
MGIMTASRSKGALQGLLGEYSTEVIPRDRRCIEAAGELLVPGSEVFIAAVPGETQDEMVTAAVRLRELGLVPVPHVTARTLVDLRDADRLLGRLRDEAGLDRLLALGGDRDRPAGELHSSLQLIESGLFPRRGIGRVFIACYPENHPTIPAEALEEARAAKLRSAADQGLKVTLISQFCFNPRPIIALAQRMRTLGIEVPYRVGVAGPADRAHLLRYGVMCGLGPSLRALARRRGFGRNLAHPETPEALLTKVADAQASEPALGITGVHFFTFGALARSAAWAERMRR